jgi:hypothetical protein
VEVAGVDGRHATESLRPHGIDVRGGTRATALATAVTALAVLGCGGGDGNGGAETTTPPDATFPEPTVPKDAPQPPKGASPVLKEIYRQFTLREPDPSVSGSAKAIAAGRKACAGKTPVEVERKYYPIAVQKGTLEPSSGQARMIAQIAKYEKHVSRDPSFVAGQLAANAYQATVPARIATFGYAGCIYVLARQLEKQLAPPG